MVLFTFSLLFDQKYPFGKFSQQKQNRQSKQIFVTQTNFNIPDSMAMFTFSVLDQKYPFWVKFGPKNQNFQLES